MNVKVVLLVLSIAMVVACKRGEQSCHDGVFDPKLEEEVDCGGVCPPCHPAEDPDDPYVWVDVNDDSFSFSDYQLSKNVDWELRFKNDSIDIRLNFGDGDSTGVRPIKIPDSYALIGNISYSNLATGLVLFGDVNHDENKLSGYFNAKFAADYDPSDTLYLVGEFHDIEW